jgi:DNA-directed RNA polymerase subunit M/transcription elongation factor TFIIS
MTDKFNRNKATIALKTVIKRDNNVSVIEKAVYSYITSQKLDEEEYINIIYQIIGDLLNNRSLPDILLSIKTNKLGWNHKDFEEMAFKILEQDDFIENPFEVVEGVITCSCGSNRVFSYNKQSRSSDEPMSTYSCCVVCNNKWVYSG